MTPSLVLASTSAPRKKLLERLKIPFVIAAPNVDETPLPDEKPDELVLRLAKQKAEAVAKLYPEHLIIGADQVGVIEQTILGKPLTLDDAKKQLHSMSGKTIKFYIGLCVFNSKNNSHQTSLETFSVVFRKLSDSVIDQYVQKENVLNCAGSFKIEGLGIALVTELIGDDYTALIGLPLIKLISMLETAGLNIL